MRIPDRPSFSDPVVSEAEIYGATCGIGVQAASLNLGAVPGEIRASVYVSSWMSFLKRHKGWGRGEGQELVSKLRK